jgi:hypothetical protein
MKIKNKFVATGLIAGLAIFGPTVTFADQTCQELPGELHLVLAKGAINDQFGENDLKPELRIRLDEEAKKTCSESRFCVEDGSIKTTFFFHTWTKILHGSMTAVVNCLK